MPSVKESQVTPYPRDALFALVADVANYPKFLPWCLGANVKKINENEFLGEMTIGHGLLKESYTSRVLLYPHEKIISTSDNGPFKNLRNEWTFKALPEGGTFVECKVDFEFRSVILGKMVGGFFAEQSRQMIQAFLGKASDVCDEKK